jgi:hypothetical protein
VLRLGFEFIAVPAPRLIEDGFLDFSKILSIRTGVFKSCLLSTEYRMASETAKGSERFRFHAFEPTLGSALVHS